MVFKSVKPYLGSAKFSELENWLMGIYINYAMAQLAEEMRESRERFLSNRVFE